ncbi:hypothetical protein [Ferroacidibacillus organovorans]|uniref:hypothetical protein n=1 Tax=Ferroacidibacillus organovorans TaxID=1765683 RepID=UPI0012E7F573|nr:hypothetical protein [Ferroacidibacillus organovorans]
MQIQTAPQDGGSHEAPLIFYGVKSMIEIETRDALTAIAENSDLMLLFKHSTT